MRTYTGYLLIAVLSLSLIAGCQKAQQEQPAAEETEKYEGWVLENVGFQTPESVLYDAAADVYYVSNLGGPQPLEKDNNGFISKIGPGGELLELKWIAAGVNDVELDAPKGMAVYGGWLLVSDIDKLRVFEIETGAHVMDVPLEGATFANDVWASKGVVWVTDTGAEGPGAIYSVMLEGEGAPMAETVVRDAGLTNPNGIVEDHDALYMVPYGGSSIFKLTWEGEYEVIATAPTGGLDGLVKLPNGGWVFTSWEGKTVYLLDNTNQIQPLFENIESPADIGYDSKRDLILIPQFMLDKVVAKVMC